MPNLISRVGEYFFNYTGRREEGAAGQTTTGTLKNALVADISGQGGPNDFGAARQVSTANIPSNPRQMQIELETLYYTDWQSQKIIDLPVEDMMREGWEYTCPTDKDVNDILTKYQEKVNFDKVLRQALCMERLYGGSVIVMGLKDSQDDPSQPLDYAAIKPDDLQFLNPVSRYHISEFIMQLDPTLPGYGKPYMYMIYGHRVHSSRLLIFDGQPIQPLREGIVPALYNIIKDGFGYPILMRLKDDLMNATGARQSAYQLIQRASMLIFSGDIQSSAAFKDANGNVSVLGSLMRSLSMYQAAILNSIPGSNAKLENIAASFGSVPELVISYLQVLSASCDIPSTRFLSQSPTGMNATGQSDLENYYNMIGAKQRTVLAPQLAKFLKVLAPSAGLKIKPEEITITFSPLWNASEIEEAQARDHNIDALTKLVDSNIITTEEARDELKQRRLLITDPDTYPDPPEQDADESSATEGTVKDKIRSMRGDKTNASDTA